MISSKSEQEKYTSWGVGRGWGKGGDISSYTASSHVFPTVIFQPSQSSLCAE